jgi:hypothetical protein
MDLLEQAATGNTCMHHTSSPSIWRPLGKISAFDLLLPRLSRPRIVARPSSTTYTIEIPEEAGRERRPARTCRGTGITIWGSSFMSMQSEQALTIVAELFKHQRPDFPASSISRVVWLCNYIEGRSDSQRYVHKICCPPFVTQHCISQQLQGRCMDN